jgi:hypothetical protein
MALKLSPLISCSLQTSVINHSTFFFSMLGTEPSAHTRQVCYHGEISSALGGSAV